MANKKFLIFTLVIQILVISVFIYVSTNIWLSVIVSLFCIIVMALEIKMHVDVETMKRNCDIVTADDLAKNQKHSPEAFERAKKTSERITMK